MGNCCLPYLGQRWLPKNCDPSVQFKLSLGAAAVKPEGQRIAVWPGGCRYLVPASPSLAWGFDSAGDSDLDSLPTWDLNLPSTLTSRLLNRGQRQKTSQQQSCSSNIPGSPSRDRYLRPAAYLF